MLRRRLTAEAFGTFCVVFAGTGAAVVDAATGGTVTHVGVALTFGLVVLAMIYALGDVSGCHLNPAVTAGFALAGRFPPRLVGPYVAAQLAGAVAGSGVLALLYPAHAAAGLTLPLDAAWRAWVLEFVLTLMLMVVVLSVATGAKERGPFAAVAVGATIALEALFAGPACGASMNPARSLAPALMAADFRHLWVYLTAPFAGAAAGVAVAGLIFPPNPE